MDGESEWLFLVKGKDKEKTKKHIILNKKKSEGQEKRLYCMCDNYEGARMEKKKVPWFPE